jgi:hypothetical protein
MKNHVSRRSFIGGSDARIIMGDDEATLLRLWREKRGEAEPEDLSGNLIVQLGLVTEPLNRIWYERNIGPECPTQCAQCLFAFFGCMKLPEPHARPSPILVDEFDPGQLQGAPNRQVVSSRHRRVAIGYLGAADRCHADCLRPVTFYFNCFARCRLLRRTPGPPPFSSMKLIPARSSVFCIFTRASSDTFGPNPPSRRLTVGTDRPACLARSV